MIILFNIRFNLNKNSVQLESPISGNYIFQTEEFSKYLDTRLWFLLNPINKDKNNEYQYSLLEGDVIRFGDKKYIVHEIYIDNPNTNYDIDNNGYDDINKDSDYSFPSIPEIDNYQRSKFSDTYNVCLCDCNNILTI